MFSNYLNYYIPESMKRRQMVKKAPDAENPKEEGLSVTNDQFVEGMIVGRILSERNKEDLVKVTSTESTIKDIKIPWSKCQEIWACYCEFKSGKQTPYDSMFTAQNQTTFDYRWERLFKSHYKAKWGQNFMLLTTIICVMMIPVTNAECCNPPLGTGNCIGNSYNFRYFSCTDLIQGSIEVNTSSFDFNFDRCTSNNLDPGSCVTSCQFNCNGSADFCSDKTCNGTKCYCDRLKMNYTYNCIDNLGLVTGPATTYIATCYRNLPVSARKRFLESVTCPMISVVADRDTVRITVDDITGLVVYVNKDTWAHQSVINSQIYTISIPQIAKMRSGDFEIVVMRSNDRCHDSKHFVDYTINCQIIDCIYCWEVFSSFNCLPFSYKAFAAFAMMLTTLSIVAMFPCMWAVIYLLWTFSMVPYKMVSGCIREKSRELNKKMKKYQDKTDCVEEEEVIKEEISEEVNNSDGTRSKVKRVRKGGMEYLFLGLICLSIPVANSLSCTTSPVISVSSAVCTQNSGTTEACTVSYSSTVTIPAPNTMICLNLVDSLGKNIGVVNLTYVNRTDVATLTNQYVTARWQSSTSSAYGCYNNGWCTSSCPSLGSSRTAFGFSYALQGWPGVSECRRSGAGWSNGCFYYDDGCVWDQYTLAYLDSVMTVASPTSMSMTPFITLSVQGNSTVSTFGQTSSSLTIGSIKVDVLGTFVGSTSLFGSNSVIFNSTKSYWGLVSAKNAPTQQNIGDIQASSVSSLTTVGSSAFIYDPAIVSKIDNSNSEQFFFKNPGMNNIGYMSQFPLTIGDSVWSYSSGILRSAASNPGSLVLTISTTSPITMTRTRTVVCPEGTFMQASGCYNCQTGATVMLSLRSKCSIGDAIITTDEPTITIGTRTISLTNSLQPFSLTIYTSKQVNSFNLKISGETDFIYVGVSFAAVQNISDVRNDTVVPPSSSSVSTASSAGSLYYDFGSWSGFIDSAFGLNGAGVKILNVLVFWASIIAMGVMAGLGIALLWKMTSPKKMKSN